MKKILGVKFTTIGLAILALSSPAMAVPVVDFVGGNIVFDGGTAATSTTFTFGAGSVTNPGVAPLFGAPVTITGTFSIGGVDGCTASCFDVGGVGTFAINGAGANDLSGTIDLVNIYQVFSSGGTNAGAIANVTVLTSTGVLAGYAPGGIVTTQFGFANPPNLDTLATTSNTLDKTASYSGTLSPVPEASSLFLLGAGLLGLAAYGRKKIMNG